MSRLLTECTVHIIGLGLMGGSLAMALNGRVAGITAEDSRPGVLKQAMAQGTIGSVGGSVAADIVVLAIPADRIISLLPTLELRPGTLVIDLGSTKALIGQQMDRLPDGVLAVGGHPMCGRAENGFGNAVPGLYAGAVFVLCATARTTPEARTLAESLVTAVGAVPRWMDPLVHDSAVALTSHLPHLLSLALMSLAMAAAEDEDNPAGIYDLAAGGFDGATRLARTDAAMLAGMLSTNTAALRTVTARLLDQLESLGALLDDPERLRARLEIIVAARRAFTNTHGERVTARLE